MAVKWTTRCHGKDSDSDITFTGTEEEIQALERALTSGNFWVRMTKDNRIVESPAMSVPPLLDDDAIAAHFQVIRNYFTDSSVKRLNRKKKKDGYECSDPSIYVQHIQGYHGDYQKSATLLESVGFECLRSRRGKDGKYWEMWYLPGAWSAKGELKDKTTEEIRKFLFSRINPSTVEINGQVWGLSLE